MAIKPQDKARILAEAGVDPTKYWLDDNGEIIDMPEQGPVETAIKTTLHNAPRTALGFAGSALGAAGAGALATPETAGLATIPAALAGGAAGGAAGGFAGQMLQEAVYPESWRFAEEARSVRAPITTKVADIGASMALMRPSATVFKAAARAPGEFLRTAGQLQPKTVEALANVGLGAGMSGGMAAAQGASPGDIALEAALGALQVQPTWLGTKLSGGLFTPFNTQGLAEPGGLPTAEAQARFTGALEAQNAPPQPTIAPDALAQLVTQFQKQQAADARRVEAGAIAAEGARQNELQRLRQAEVAAAIPPTQGATAVGSLYPFVGERPIGRTVQRGRRAAAPEVEPTVLPVDTRTIDERLAATGGAPEQQMKLTPAAEQAEEARLRGASPVEQELAMLLSPEQHKYFRDVFAKYDTEYQDVPELDASGRFVPRKSAAEPSRTDISSLAYLDVYPHEALHALLSDTLNYGTARERAFTERALRELGIEVLTDANGRKSLAEGGEETLAKQVGEEAIRVLAGKQKPAPVREAFSDFVDYLINDKLTPDVARRILRDRTVFGAGTRGIVARAARRGGATAAAGAPPVMAEAAEQKPAAQAPAPRPFESVELPERLAPTRDMTPEQIAQVEAAREAARTPPPAAEAEAAQAQRRADALAARAEQMKTLLDEQEARLRRLESAERTRQRISALPESPLGLQRRAAREEARTARLAEFEQARPSIREEEGVGLLTQEERDHIDAQRYADTGGEIPMSPEAIGEDFPPPTLRALPAEDPRVREARQRAFENAQDELENPPAPRPPGSVRRGAARAARRAERGSQRAMRGVTPEDVMPGSEVTRPETRTYEGESIPQNIRRGRMEREAARETPEDLEMRRIEARLAGEERPRFQELQPERVFLSEFEKELSRENPFRFQVGKDGRINANDIRVAVKKLNESERGMLDEAGLNNFLARMPRPTKEELAEWANENLPKVEVKELWAEGKVDKYEQEVARLRHELDTRFPTGRSRLDENYQPRREYLELRDQYDEARIRWSEADTDTEMDDSATRAYTMVNPRGLADMPGAVDLLVRIPVKNAAPKLDASETHYSKSGDNLLAHVRAYEHTMPNGEKVLRVFEVQSDWAQQKRKQLAEIEKTGNKSYPEDLLPDDPLLPQHQRLALKAAVEHARKRGINKLVVDDAETAMLTEGHDLVIHMARATVAEANDAFLAAAGEGPWLSVGDALKQLNARFGISGAKFEYRGGRIVMTREPYTGGMKLAYDNVLQQQMRDMAGEGTKVDLGEHKNAIVIKDAPGGGEWLAVRPINTHQPRPDLIFKNPDGTPKITSTGYLYDISAPQARREAGEPFSLTGRRYQPLGPERGSFKGAKLPERETPFRGIFAGNVEALRRTGDPDKIAFAGIADELYARIRNYTGKYENALIAPLENLPTESRNRIIETMYDEDMDRKSYATRLNVKEQIAHRAIRGALKRMRQEQIAANQLINGKPAGIDPFYFPNIIDSTILHDLANSPESARAKEAERQFVEFNKDLFVKRGVSPTDAQTKAEEAFGKFIGSLKPMAIDSGFDYGAVSLPASTKLPPTWIQGDAVESFRNYAKRFGRARAFYDVMGRDENAMRLLGYKNYFDAAGKEVPVTNPGSRLVRDPNVRNLMESALGVTHESQEGWTPSVGRLANTLLLSNVMSRLTDVSTTPFKALSYLPVTRLPGLIKNLGNMRQSMENAYNTGGVRRGGLMVVREVLGAGDTYINKLDKVTQFITRVTGSEALERGSRFLSQNIGEYIYDVNSALARAGDKRADEFLRRLAPQWDTLAREEVAQRIAQLFQGRYDATNLPNWIQNSPAAPFFSMVKWNIEQWNNFKRFAWEPAKQGDVMPLVKTILGGVIGGLAVGEMREKITGKKQRVATFNELKYGFDEGDKTQAGLEAMRKAAFLAQVTGTIGVVGELALQGLDIAARDKPQGFSWPAFNLAASVLARVQNAGNAAIDNPQDAGLILGTAVNDLAKEVFTQYRIAMSVPDRVLKGSRGDTEQANRRRDLRMSEKMHGEEVRRSPYIEADYAGTRERRFDRETDMNKALEIARTLDRNARASSRTVPEYLEKRRKFRAMRIAGIPSVDNDPMQYFRHLQYVRATQGNEAADALAADYARLRMEQKFKSSLFQ